MGMNLACLGDRRDASVAGVSGIRRKAAGGEPSEAAAEARSCGACCTLLVEGNNVVSFNMRKTVFHQQPREASLTESNMQVA